MRISVSVEYQLPMPRPPISRVPTAFTSSMLPCLTPGILESVGGVFASDAEEAGAEEAGGGSDGAALGGVLDGLLGGLDCGLDCGLFWPYPVRVKAGESNRLLATINSAEISFLRSILLIPTSGYTWSDNRRRSSLWLLDQVCALWLAHRLEFRKKVFTTLNGCGSVPAGARTRASWPETSSPAG